MFRANVAQKIKTNLMCNVSFYEILIVYKIMWGIYGTVKQTINDRITQRTHFAFLDNYAFKHTLRICNTYRFSAVTMVK
jgi:hypothetical protein